MKLKRVLIVVAVAGGVSAAGAGAVAGYGYLEEKRQAAQRVQLEQRAREAMERRRAEEKASTFGLVKLVPEPAEGKVERDPQRTPLLEAIKQTKSPVIVLPPAAPMSRPRVDLTARIAIARQLAHLIEAESGAPVPDPELVLQALDTTQTTATDFLRGTLMPSTIQWLVTGTVWHDANGKMSMKLVKVPVYAQPPVTSAFERLGIAISDERPPEIAFQPIALEAVRALGFKGTEVAAVQEDAAASLALPASPLELDKTGSSLSEAIWSQQLLGVLHHPLRKANPRPRERVFERTLAGLFDLSAQSADYPVLMARSLTYLGRPIAAIKLLETAPATPETKALQAYLHGDLLALKAAVPSIERKLPHLIAECELISLRHELGDLSEEDQRKEIERLTRQVPEGWQELVALYVAHQSPWTVPPPSVIKPLLDRAYPVNGYRGDDIVRGKTALGDSPEDRKTAVELLVSPLVHARKWREGNPDAICCDQGSSWRRVPGTQYLDLLEALAKGEIVLRFHYLTFTQGRPDAALAQMDVFDDVYFHRADVDVLSARIEAMENLNGRDKNSDPTGQRTLEAAGLARRILSWDGGQDHATAVAFAAHLAGAGQGYRAQVPRPGPMRPRDVEVRVLDFPGRADWMSYAAWALNRYRFDDFVLKLRRDSCNNALGEVWYCSEYFKLLKQTGDGERYRQEITALLDGRFAGSGERARLLAEVKLAAGDRAGAEALLKEAIRASASQQENYLQLGRLQLEDGRYADAAKTFLDFPGLKGKPDNTVGLSNYLIGPAKEFAAKGAEIQARQLLAVVAGYGDGSYANLDGIVRLAVMDGKYELARDTLQQQYQRYHDGHSVEQLASMMFMLGRVDEAWAALAEGAEHADIGSPPYRAAPIGLRMVSADTARIAAWCAAAADSAKNYSEPMDVAFETVAVDRTSASVRSLYEIDKQARAAMKVYKVPHQPLGEKEPFNEPTHLPKTPYIEGYAAFLDRDYRKTVEFLAPEFEISADPKEKATSALGNVRFLPHLALAAAKSGAGDRFATAFDALRPPGGTARPGERQSEQRIPDLAYYLVLAVQNALKGDHAQALNHVQRARSGLHLSAWWFEDAYVYVEILERLSEETGYRGYVAAALDYVRSYERVKPWTAWAYAVEAKHLPPGPARVRAAAIALKLDPQSRRLRSLDAQTLQQARSWAAAHHWPSREEKAPRVAEKWNRT